MGYVVRIYLAYLLCLHTLSFVDILVCGYKLGYPCHCMGGGLCDVTTGSCGDAGCDDGKGTDEIKVVTDRGAWGGPGCQIGNVAYGKTATQRATYYTDNLVEDFETYEAGNCVDGNRYNEDADSGSCCWVSLNTSEDDWWRVDLGGDYIIFNVTIVNRNDDNENLQRTHIELETSTGNVVRCGTVGAEDLTQDDLITVMCSNDVYDQAYRYVTLRQYDSVTYARGLSVCEIYVTGFLYKSSCDVDLVFVIDGSESIDRTTSNFLRMKQFMNGIIDELDISNTTAQIGVVQFSSVAQNEFYLNTYKNKEDVKKAVLSIDMLDQGTETDKGLEAMYNNQFNNEKGDRIESPNIVIVMTDGYSKYPNWTRSWAVDAQSAGIKMFAVGITLGVDKEELAHISSDPHIEGQHYFMNYNFTTLTSSELTSHITKEICTVVTGCESGYYGPGCMLETQCREGGGQNCVSCNDASGECRSCNAGYELMSTDKQRCQGSKDGIDTVYVILFAAGGLLLLLLATAIGILCTVGTGNTKN